MAIQVWLLRSDGVGVALKEKTYTVQAHNGGGAWEIMTLGFEHVSAPQLAGVVVSVNGKLYVREIKAS